MTKIILILIISLSYAYAQDKCIETRAAFDIGSGATKMKVYHYNTCSEELELKDKPTTPNFKCNTSLPVAYKEDLKTHLTIQSSTVEQGITALKKLKKIAIQCGAKHFSAVATSAFRQAKNGTKVAEKISQATQIKVKVISQKEEANLGFIGAKIKTRLKVDENFCVWDIGGSSMQIVCNNVSNIFMGKVASVSFKNQIIAHKYQSGQQVPLSPNPITTNDYRFAQSITSDVAKKIREVFGKKLQSYKVIGIGGVHYYSISKEIGQSTFDAEAINMKIQNKLDLSDIELGGGPYVSTAVTNLILVEGIMKHLKIPQVQAVQVNLTEGLVSSPQYW